MSDEWKIPATGFLRELDLRIEVFNLPDECVCGLLRHCGGCVCCTPFGVIDTIEIRDTNHRPPRYDFKMTGLDFFTVNYYREMTPEPKPTTRPNRRERRRKK